MRRVVYSATFHEQFRALLDMGLPLFGAAVIANKRDRVRATIEAFLVAYPAVKRPHPELGLVAYPIRDTPFVVLYDFDDAELRVHFILHKHASLDDLDPAAAQW